MNNQLSRSPPAIGNDTALFLYTGREFLGGRVVYKYIWDIKPPAIHELSAIFSFVAGGDPFIHYILFIGTTIFIAGGVCALLALVAYQLTGVHIASFTAGIAPLAYTPFLKVASLGIRPKYFTCFFGLLCIFFYLKQRPVLSIAAATVATSFWQLGVLFPAAVLVGEYVEHDANWRTIGQMGGVMMAVAAAFIAPVALQGAFLPMVAQVGIAPFVAGEPGSILAHYSKLRGIAGSSIVLIWIGVYGWFTIVKSAGANQRWWVAATIAWFSVQVLYFDLDAPPDLIPLVVFVSLGIAIVSDHLGKRDTDSIAGSLFILYLVGLLVLFAVPITGQVAVGGTSQNLAEQLFWTGESATKCHVQLSTTEEVWLERTPANIDDRTCWPQNIGSLADLVSF